MFTRILIIGVFAAVVGLAQGDMGGGGGMGGRGGDMGGNIPMAPRVTTTIDRLGEMLKLDKDQKKAVKEMFDNAQKEALPLRDQMSKSRIELAAAIQAGKPQADLDQAANACAALDTKMTEIELKAFTNLFTALKPDQRKEVGRVFGMMAGMFQGKNWNEGR
jgi:uncharacterized membrane protein